MIHLEIHSKIRSEIRPDKKQMIKDAKGKNVGKRIFSSFRYFEENDPYRIERSPVITGDLKMKMEIFGSQVGISASVARKF